MLNGLSLMLMVMVDAAAPKTCSSLSSLSSSSSSVHLFLSCSFQPPRAAAARGRCRRAASRRAGGVHERRASR